MSACDDAKVVIALKAAILIGVIVEYWLGKRTGDGRARSGAELVFNTTRAAVFYIIFLIIAALIKIKEWKDKNAK